MVSTQIELVSAELENKNDVRQKQGWKTQTKESSVKKAEGKKVIAAVKKSEEKSNTKKDVEEMMMRIHLAQSPMTVA